MVALPSACSRCGAATRFYHVSFNEMVLLCPQPEVRSIPSLPSDAPSFLSCDCVNFLSLVLPTQIIWASVFMFSHVLRQLSGHDRFRAVVCVCIIAASIGYDC